LWERRFETRVEVCLGRSFILKLNLFAEQIELG